VSISEKLPLVHLDKVGRVCTWNVDSLTGRSGELVEALAERRMDVACVQETRSINQSINVKFVGRRYTRRPGAPTVVSGTHDQKVHS